MRERINILIVVVLLLIQSLSSYAQEEVKDTITIQNPSVQKQDQLYDSLGNRANRKKFTKIIYDFLVTPPRPYVDKEALALDYYSKYEGKVISQIEIKALDVYGPRFDDLDRTARSLFEKTANKIHTKSNLKTI